MPHPVFVRLGAALGGSVLLFMLGSAMLVALANPTVSFASEHPLSPSSVLLQPAIQAAPELANRPEIRTAPVFSATALLAPTQGAVLTTTRPSFQWEPASGEVASYTLVISGVTQLRVFTSTSPAYTSTTALASGPYTWTVQAHNTAGQVSGFVPPYTFTIAAVPGFGPNPLLAPVSGIVLTNSRPTLAWREPISGEVVSYTLRLTGPLTNTSEVTASVPVYTVTRPLPSGAYTWTVQAHNGAGEVSGFVAPYTFTLDSRPRFGPNPLLTPTHGVTLTEPGLVFSWLPASGEGISYTLYLTGPTTAVSFTTTAAHYTVTLTSNGAYTWTVAAYDLLGQTSGPVAPPNTFSLAATWSVYLPAVIKAFSCPIDSAAQFDLIPIEGNPADRPGPLHADLNLALRGYELTSAPKVLVGYAGATDPQAPQLDGLFNPDAYPGIANVYRVNGWDWGCGPPEGCATGPVTDWPVTLLGLKTTQGQPIAMPKRGPDIYQGVYRAMVAYAEERRITLLYTRQDTVAAGYAVHIDNVCVDPNLLAAYRAQTDAAGWHVTGRLPALRTDQVLGTAVDDEIRVAVRDRGAFMDPRSQKDWWQKYPAGLQLLSVHDTLSNKLVPEK